MGERSGAGAAKRGEEAMTKRKAIEILITHAARNVAGQGCGIRPSISERERDEVKQAILKMYHDAHRRYAALDDLFNLGF